MFWNAGDGRHRRWMIDPGISSDRWSGNFWQWSILYSLPLAHRRKLSIAQLCEALAMAYFVHDRRVFGLDAADLLFMGSGIALAAAILFFATTF